MASWYIFMWIITVAAVACLAVVVSLCIWMSVTYRRDVRSLMAQRHRRR